MWELGHVWFLSRGIILYFWSVLVGCIDQRYLFLIDFDTWKDSNIVEREGEILKGTSTPGNHEWQCSTLLLRVVHRCKILESIHPFHNTTQPAELFWGRGFCWLWGTLPPCHSGPDPSSWEVPPLSACNFKSVKAEETFSVAYKCYLAACRFESSVYKSC